MNNQIENQAPGSGSLSPIGAYEKVVGLAIRTELLKLMDKIGEDIRARVKICRRCGMYFVARRRGEDIKWCDNCK